ncbi:hypothetical protein [Niastella sp. OAS944]|uniref:hypothetical protein n=1 Tax=Niastella sp. OAS944 TaxID=2664089 RepID=UPI003474CB86|nr:beta-lactamase superfamily II metal-dependent hydrolase [Chitinophagaceae bacterium OAS944]
MKLIIYQAECGDAARIEYQGSDGRLHHIFIDSGFERTFRNALATDIRSIVKTTGCIDLWLISHIHDDHIGGAIAYLKNVKKGLVPDIVHSWAYNPPRGNMKNSISLTGEVSTAKSVVQGDQLANYLFATRARVHKEVTTSTGLLNIHGLEITFLSPDDNALAALRKKYAPELYRPFEREEDFVVSAAKAAVNNDYATRLNDFELNSHIEDNSIENGSSISVLTNLNGKQILWLADAHSSLVVRSLQALGYTIAHPLVCDWVKLSHHGSSANNLLPLFEIVRCNNYLISSNGENKHRLPNKECIARILRNPYRTTEKYHLHFTYDNPTLRGIFSADGPEIFDELNFEAHYFSMPSTSIEC